MKQSLWLFALPLVFLGYSVPIFLRVLTTTQQVIDEEFHIPQGLAYCNHDFHKWNPKITTFPGLYFAAVALNPLGLCSVFGLRLISLLAATINVVLFFKIKCYLGKDSSRETAAFEAITIAALPPLYFFSHFYYSDTLSLTMVLAFYYYWQQPSSRLLSAVYAAASVLMRQTNVVWVTMCLGIDALNIFLRNYAEHYAVEKQSVSLWSYKVYLKGFCSIKVILKTIWQTLAKDGFLLTIVLPFIGFVYVNGSIVLGDKSAHKAALHAPQLFYFSLFVTFFALANDLQHIKSALKTMQKHLLAVAVLMILMLLIVHFNTLEHKYLLSDNRHYVFYVWNRFYRRYFWFKYAMVPFYMVGMILIFQGLTHMTQAFHLMFFIAVFISLCFQRLLELRYFLVPFVIFRLHCRPSAKNPWLKWIELSFYIVLNAITFYLFFTKEIKWKNYTQPQRIIW